MEIRQTIKTERGGQNYWRGRKPFVVQTYVNGVLRRECYSGGTMTEARQCAEETKRELQTEAPRSPLGLFANNLPQ